MRRTVLKRAGIFLNWTEALIWPTQNRMATEFIKHLLRARPSTKGFANPVSLNSQMSQSYKIELIFLLNNKKIFSALCDPFGCKEYISVSKASNNCLKNSICKIFWHNIPLFSLFPGLQTLTAGMILDALIVSTYEKRSNSKALRLG